MFTLHTSDDGRGTAILYLPCGAITPKVGMALTQTDGNLAIATGTTAPTYISLFEASEAVTAGTIIPVMRVSHDCIYKTTNSAALTSVAIGSKVTLHATDGMQVTATTASGVAEIVRKDGDAVGSDVYVRF